MTHYQTMWKSKRQKVVSRGLQAHLDSTTTPPLPTPSLSPSAREREMRSRPHWISRRFALSPAEGERVGVRGKLFAVTRYARTLHCGGPAWRGNSYLIGHSSLIVLFFSFLVAISASALDIGVASCDITPDVKAHKVPLAGY